MQVNFKTYKAQGAENVLFLKIIENMVDVIIMCELSITLINAYKKCLRLMY